MSYGTATPKRRSKICGIPKFIVWIILGFAIVVIVVPIIVMFSKKKKGPPPKSNVLLPLYVYPAPGAWDPLFTA